MASFLPHLVIPGLFALAFIPVERKRILLWLPLVWVPDLDYIIPSQHRAVTHSVLVPVALAAILVWRWKVRAPQARFWEYATRPGLPANLLLATYLLLSHLVLDLFMGGVVILWPLLNINFLIYYGIVVNTATNEFAAFGDAATGVGAPELTPEFLWFSPLDTGIAVLLAASLLIVWLARPTPPLVIERHARRAEDAHAPAPADATTKRGGRLRSVLRLGRKQ